jgi:hypothetical protein
MVAATVERIEGIIACVASNQRGFKLQGRDGWINLSKWAEVPAIPINGTPVLVTVDAQGYCRSIQHSATAPMSKPEQPASDAPELPATVPPDKDTQIRRMNAVTSAVAALSTVGPVDEAELFALAERIERWVCR